MKWRNTIVNVFYSMGIVLLIKNIDYLISIANKCNCEQMLREHFMLRTNVGEEMAGYLLFIYLAVIVYVREELYQFQNYIFHFLCLQVIMLSASYACGIMLLSFKYECTIWMPRFAEFQRCSYCPINNQLNFRFRHIASTSNQIQ